MQEPPGPGRARDRIARWSSALGPGLGLALAITAFAALGGVLQRASIGQDVVEPIVIALVAGVALRTRVHRPERFLAGTDFASKGLLEVSIVLIGASLDLRQILAPGLILPLVVVWGVAASLAVSFFIGRRLGLSRNLAVLVAVGNSICGNSAIVAVAPIISATKNEVASALALTAVLGVTLVLALPLVITIASLDHYQYGVLAGMSVYSVPQVVAAAFRVSDVAGNVATIVKLTRVLLLGPIVIIIAALVGARGETGTRFEIRRFVPWFVAAFLAVATARTIGLIPAPLAASVTEIGRWLTVVAMAGLGFGVQLAVARTVGPRVGVVVMLSLAFMIAFTLAAIAATGIP